MCFLHLATVFGSMQKRLTSTLRLFADVDALATAAPEGRGYRTLVKGAPQLGKARVDVSSVTTAVLDLAKLSFFGALRPCVTGVEACGSAHLKGVVRD